MRPRPVLRTRTVPSPVVARLAAVTERMGVAEGQRDFALARAARLEDALRNARAAVDFDESQTVIDAALERDGAS